MANTRKSFLQCIFGCSASKSAPESFHKIPESVSRPADLEHLRDYEAYRFKSIWEGQDTTILCIFRWPDGDSGVSVQWSANEVRFDVTGWSHGYLIPSIKLFRFETCKYSTDPAREAVLDEIIARYSSCKWETSSAEDINGFIRRASELIGGEDFWIARMLLLARPLVSAWVELRETGRRLGPITDFMDLDSYRKMSWDTEISAPVKEQMNRYMQTLGDYTDSSSHFDDVSYRTHSHVQALLAILIAPSDGRVVENPITPRYRRDDVSLGYRSKRMIGSISVVAEGGVYQIELTHPSTEFKPVSVLKRD